MTNALETALAFAALIATGIGICWADARLERRRVIRHAEKTLRKAARHRPAPSPRPPDPTGELFAIPRPDPADTEEPQP
ncbi:hypothetical protein BX265_4981 [Streptomyces sp. TLI_235]|nr:hypothetical protein [Streptomyces sp. TLI_235]PBC80145.1 hypothetical protein BX265_4981 [Streptomyces sp. TLI_235]